jgi:glycosyltransferase involved in cell wall biosynthesis
MDVTVAICTWNRARLLDATLAQMCNLRVPSGTTWELLVVDNNCTDDTPAVVERYSDRLPLRRIVEPKQGIASARNCVLRNAAADLLVCTDDDVLVAEDWLQEYIRASERWPAAAFFGGPITPWYEHEPPQWFRDNHSCLAASLALLDLGPIEGEIPADTPPFGANMAIRRKAFATQWYDAHLGRNKLDQIGAEETTYFRLLAANGFRGVWVPSARVRHYVVAKRMTLDYVRRYWIGAGRTEVRLAGASGQGTPRWVYRALIRSYAMYAWHRSIRHPGWIQSLVQASRMRGVWLEHSRGHAAET